MLDNDINEWKPLSFVYHVIDCNILKCSSTDIRFARKLGSSSQYYFHKVANEVVLWKDCCLREPVWSADGEAILETLTPVATLGTSIPSVHSKMFNSFWNLTHDIETIEQSFIILHLLHLAWYVSSIILTGKTLCSICSYCGKSCWNWYICFTFLVYIWGLWSVTVSTHKSNEWITKSDI
jgi:hypothetical protein